MSDEIIRVSHLGKSFGNNVVLRDINFTVSRGDVTSIIGSSGSANRPSCAASTCWRRLLQARYFTMVNPLTIKMSTLRNIALM